MWADQPPKIWTPPKPAIIRPARDLVTPAVSFLVAPPLFKSAAAAAANAAVSYLYGSGFYPNSSNSRTYSGVPFGADDASRRILFSYGYGSTGAVISSATVGGATAIQVAPVFQTGNFRNEMWMAPLPSGASGSIVVNMTANNADQISIVVWRVTGLLSTTPTDTQSGTNAQNQSVNLNISAGGIGVGHRMSSNGTNRTFVWTGLTEDADFTVSSGVITSTAASAAFAAAQTPLAVTCNANGTLFGGVGRYASFR